MWHCRTIYVALQSQCNVCDEADPSFILPVTASQMQLSAGSSELRQLKLTVGVKDLYVWAECPAAGSDFLVDEKRSWIGSNLVVMIGRSEKKPTIGLDSVRDDTD